MGRAQRHARYRVEQRPLTAPGTPSQQEAGLRRDDTLVALEPGVGAAVAEAANRGVDQPRVLRGKRFVAHAEPLGDAGAECLDHRVGPRRQPPRRGLVILQRQVERHALLSAPPLKVGGMAAERVAARRLDRNHLGAGVGEEHRGERAGEALAEVDDGNPVAGLLHGEGHGKRIAAAALATRALPPVGAIRESPFSQALGCARAPGTEAGGRPLLQCAGLSRRGGDGLGLAVEQSGRDR